MKLQQQHSSGTMSNQQIIHMTGKLRRQKQHNRKIWQQKTKSCLKYLPTTVPSSSTGFKMENSSK